MVKGGGEMLLENFVAQKQTFPTEARPKPPPPEAPVVSMTERLLDSKAGEYDTSVAYWLMVASCWAYSDGQELANVMSRQGLGECIVEEVSSTNNAMFVTATAYLIRSPDGKVGILCFRGTEPNNIITWVLDASVSTVPFAGGRVHGGFYRNVQCIWNYVVGAIGQAIAGEPIVIPRTRGKINVAVDAAAGNGGGALAPSNGHPRSPRKIEVAPLEALYVTGHSLGAAMAAVAAAEIFTEPQYRGWREIGNRDQPLLRGIYTFGQPMVGDLAMTTNCAKQFGSLTFRHVFGKDIVPRLPPWTTGRFHHFGVEYHGTVDGWSLRSRAVTQCATALVSLPIGAAAWIFQQFPHLRNIRLPFSFIDHSPISYLEASKAVVNRASEWT
jgi:hypothetical protein